MISGYKLEIEDALPLADAAIGLVEHRIAEEEFVRILRPFVAPVG